MQALLFANGELNSGVMLDRLLDSLESPHVVCADGGARHARALGLTPHAIIGDMDSLSADEVAQFKAARAQIIRYRQAKDETDLELALHYCQKIGAESVSILGALGGRIDQTLANIFLLTLPDFGDMRIGVIDGDQSLCLLPPGSHRIQGARGDTISLIPLATVEGVNTGGLRYPLADESLRLGPARGISNVMLTESAAIEFREGLLLLVHTSGRA